MLENKDFDINRLLHEIREVIEKQVYERGISLSEKEYNLEYRYLNGSPVIYGNKHIDRACKSAVIKV